ncbi:MAG: folate-binding protein, partial [Hyphomicrobium sp.]
MVLPDRGIVAVNGSDATKLLQGLVTNDVALLDTQPAIYAGLLSPQGKILFDFIVVKTRDGALIDVAKDQAAALVKRLTMYKLRAAVTIADVSADHTVVAAFGPDAQFGQGIVYSDPRLPDLGLRAIVETKDAVAVNSEASAYHAFRIGLGVPEGGLDYAFGDAFPHEALFDQLHGVSFTKGCYVGQEIVSRMEHRGTARKRIVPVNADGPLVEGAAVMAGEVEIGRVGSVAGSRGLALLRLDRVDEFAAKG